MPVDLSVNILPHLNPAAQRTSMPARVSQNTGILCKQKLEYRYFSLDNANGLPLNASDMG